MVIGLFTKHYGQFKVKEMKYEKKTNKKQFQQVSVRSQIYVSVMQDIFLIQVIHTGILLNKKLRHKSIFQPINHF